MINPVDLVRADLRDFAGYRSARSENLQGEVWLNANEASSPNAADASGVLRRYPDPQPQALRMRLSELYGCDPEQLLAGRGSDEGIDLLVRALCEPGNGAIVVTSPTFGMYAVCARLQGARVVDVPLRDTGIEFACDYDAVAAAALAANARLMFLCSPGNPSGSALSLQAIGQLCSQLEDHAVVVVDEAYSEFSDSPSAVSLLEAHSNIAVLRTLSKAHALAAARIGTVIADARLIEVLRRCQAPYPMAAPCVDMALRALDNASQAQTRSLIATTLSERLRLTVELRRLASVRSVYTSAANFLLVRFDDAQVALDGLLAAGIVVRDMRHLPGLHDALRITIGRPEDNDRVLAAVAAVADVAVAA